MAVELAMRAGCTAQSPMIKTARFLFPSSNLGMRRANTPKKAAAKTMLTQRSRLTLAGKSGETRQIQESSHGYRTGYFV